jgi:hypothetical protein
MTPKVPDRTVLRDKILSHCVFAATVYAPLASIDIADWLFRLPDEEYRRCAPPDHKAAASTTTDDGRPVSITVEMIGTGLVVQRYIADIATPDHCRMVSISDELTPHGWTTCQVIWDLKADGVDTKVSRYTNTITSHPTVEFMEFIAKNGFTYEEVTGARQAAYGDHCRRETPLLAASIGRHALLTTEPSAEPR